MGLLVFAAMVALGFSGAADNPTLTATVGTDDGFTIGITDASGARVTHLDPGTYTLVVRDRSSFHNFHLFGSGIADIATSIDAIGESTYSVTFADGIYTYQCDPHASQGMKGQFTVGSASLPQPAPPPAVKKATASIVGSKATVRGLAKGKVAITVIDRSKTDGFLLQGPGVAKKTGNAFTGTVTWTVTLQAGTYSWGSAAHPKLRRRILLN